MSSGQGRPPRGLGLSLPERLQDKEGRQGRVQALRSSRPGLRHPFWTSASSYHHRASWLSSLERWRDAIATREKQHFLLPQQRGQGTRQWPRRGEQKCYKGTTCVLSLSPGLVPPPLPQDLATEGVPLGCQGIMRAVWATDSSTKHMDHLSFLQKAKEHLACLRPCCLGCPAPRAKPMS